MFGAVIPDLRGLVLMGQSTTYPIATTGGEYAHKLTAAESGLPDHTHQEIVGWGTGSSLYAMWDGSANAGAYGGSAGGSVNGGAKAAANAHQNMQPYRTVRWITIAG